MKKFAILIPTMISRSPLYDRCVNELRRQIVEDNAEEFFEIIPDLDSGEASTGIKRNRLVNAALSMGITKGSFVDDDDLPGPTYIKRAKEFALGDFDCAELWGNIFWNGKKGKPFHHSIKYKDWSEDNQYYYRCVNHLNFMKFDLIKDYPFPDQSFGEDGVASYNWRDAGIFKTEMPIPEVIYNYFCGTPKNEIK